MMMAVAPADRVGTRALHCVGLLCAVAAVACLLAGGASWASHLTALFPAQPTSVRGPAHDTAAARAVLGRPNARRRDTRTRSDVQRWAVARGPEPATSSASAPLPSGTAPLPFAAIAAVGAAAVAGLAHVSRGRRRPHALSPLRAQHGDVEAESEERPLVWTPVLRGRHVVYERSNDDVLMLSWATGSKDWLAFANPEMPLEFGQEYFRAQAMAVLCTGPHDRVLVLGLGLGALPSTVRAIDRKTHVDVVEVDAEVIEGTTKLLPLELDDHLQIFHADASEFVKRQDRVGYYDYVLFDCYTAAGVPSSLLSEEFLKDAVRCLKPKGVFGGNFDWRSDKMDSVRQLLGSLLVTPQVTFCKTTSNCIIFGAATAAGEPLVSPNELMMAAVDMDASALLPYTITSFVESLQPLSEWTPPERA